MTNKSSSIFSSKNIIIFTGHFGSGKTENAVNYSLAINCEQQTKYEDTTLIDLDIINPYFRSRELQQMLNNNGVKTILPNKQMQQVDFPVIPPQIKASLSNPTGKIIVDLGGNPDGATTMGGFKRTMQEESYEMWLVVNVNRLQTSNLNQIMTMADQIEKASRLNLTGIINNTHLKNETTIDNILTGVDMCNQLSQRLQLPLIYSAIPSWLQNEVTKYKHEIGEYLLLDRFLTEPWDLS